jgi:hypothetical protein
MKYIECPERYKGNKTSLFLAGGISGCLDWQSHLVNLLKDEDLVLLNPRRKFFETENPQIEEEQIPWEFYHLKKASAISFWFTKETVCPITLYELGKQSVIKKPVFVGVHPNYSRKRDVEIQIRLERPEIQIVYDLESLAEQIKLWGRNGK